MSTEAKDNMTFKPFGVLLAFVGLGLIGAGVLGIERGLMFTIGNFVLFGGIATFMYQTFVDD